MLVVLIGRAHELCDVKRVKGFRASWWGDDTWVGWGLVTYVLFVSHVGNVKVVELDK